MKNDQITLPLDRFPVDLWRDKWSGLPRSYVIDSAAHMIAVVKTDEPLQQHLRSRAGLREGATMYADLLDALYALAKAKCQKPRRLTWRERITGRLKP